MIKVPSWDHGSHLRSSQQDRILHFKAMVFPLYNFVSTSILKEINTFQFKCMTAVMILKGYHTGIGEYCHNVEVNIGANYLSINYQV